MDVGAEEDPKGGAAVAASFAGGGNFLPGLALRGGEAVEKKRRPDRSLGVNLPWA